MKSILTSLFSLVLCAALHAQIPSYVPTDGLVGWWPFNGNANDESGNGNDFSAYNVLQADDRFGNLNSAFEFNGVELGGGSSLVSDSTIFNIGQEEYSIQFWFKINDLNQVTRALINTIPHTGLAIGFNDNNIPGRIVYDVGPADAFWTYLYQAGQFTNFNTESWYNIVFLKQGTTYSFYFNGILESTLLNPQATNYNYDVQLRVSGISPEYQIFDGLIDDMAFWNRALTPAEITQLYTAAEEPAGECNLIASETQDTPVEVGGSAQMYVTLNATDYSMQWQTNAAGLGWMDVQDNITYTGSQTQNLLISNATLANHEQPFRIIVTDGICNDTSDVAMLVINNTCTAYDTIINVVDVFDTLTIENVIDVFDTTTVFNTVEVFDTLTIYNTVDVFDTTEVVVETFDTITNVIDVFDTTTVYLQVDIFDTLFFDVFDTTYVVNTIDVYDTTYIQVIDTAYATVIDTLLIDITFVGFEGQPSHLNTVLVYPNPTSDHITIDYGNFALMAGYNTIITDAAGATVYSSAVNAQQASIDINAWGAAGVYYLSVYDVNGSVVAVRQIVIQ